jgi:hypothetical protein
MLEREEYVEQAYFYRTLAERLPENIPLQDLLFQLQTELLASTRLPIAVNFMLTELKHGGAMSPAMARMSHYFSPFQAYVIREAESEQGRFDMRIALRILEAEADHRARKISQQACFFFQFECLCRNRLRYDAGLTAIAADPVYDPAWRDWILLVRKDVGLVDLGELVFLHSQEYAARAARDGQEPLPATKILFGEKEGRIALATRRKDPLFLFAAMQRHLDYPSVPRPTPPDPTEELFPQLMRRVERLEIRIKLMEDEQRQGIDLTKFFQKPNA